MAIGIPLLSFLDPRPAAEAAEWPLADSVNIPADEIAARVAELPRKDEVIHVIGPEPYRQQAIEILRELGRSVESGSEPFIEISNSGHGVGLSQAGEPKSPSSVREVSELANRERGIDRQPRSKSDEKAFPIKGRLWRPNDFLEETVQDIKPGTALDLGCGTGRDAVYLASLGWEVTGVDILPDAVERGEQLAWRYLAATSRLVESGENSPHSKGHTAVPQSKIENRKSKIAFSQLDLSKSLPAKTYDLVTCFFYFNPEVLFKIHTVLSLGGLALIELFTDEDKAKRGKPKKTVNPADLPNLLKNLQINKQQEGWHHGRHTVRVIAKVR